MASLLSVNVGMPKDVPWQGKTVHTGIWKASVSGPQTVRRLNIDGDGQGDTAGHGGENRAVMVYQIESYQHWQQQFERDDLEFGAFGENFTVDGMADTEVCIGDRFRIGTAEFEVTQPRVTCFRVGMRLGVPDMASLLVSHHRPGFYLRVITEGVIEAGDEIIQTSSGPHQISVAAIDALLYLPNRDLDLMRHALEIPALSPGWQGSFREILAAGSAGGPPIGAEPGWVGFKSLRVTRIVNESSAVTSFYLEAADALPLPPALPGQYLTLRVPGAGSPAPVRSYSLSSAPRSGAYRVSIKSESHGLVSRYLHSRVQPGTLLDAAAPRGDFVLRDGTAPVLLISAGIGVTPVIAMLQQLVAQHSSREVWWIHGARNEQENALADEAHSLLAALPHAHEYLCYSAADAVVDPRIRRGRLTAAELATFGLPSDGAAYICGPAGFMADMRQALETIGLPAGQIYTELFGALDAINPGVVGHTFVPAHQPPGEPGTGPLITFARSGLSTPDGAAHRSLLETAESCDVPTRFSCRTGVCHTCTTALLSGEIVYSPTPLELPPAGDVLVCVARPVTDVVLDM